MAQLSLDLATAREPTSAARTGTARAAVATDLIGQFVGLRENRFTRAGYHAALERFAAFCAVRDLRPEEADTHTIAAFREELAACWAPATVRFELAALASFFRWLRATGVRSADPTRPVVRPPRESDAIPTLEAATAVKVLEAAGAAGPRPGALCALFLLYAMPTSAVAQLAAADVRPRSLEGPQLRARLHGGRRRLLALVEPANTLLVAQAAAVDPDGPLFPGEDHQGRSTRHVLAREVTRAAAAVDPQVRVTPQVLRATHVAALGREDGESEVVDRSPNPPYDVAATVWARLQPTATS